MRGGKIVFHCYKYGLLKRGKIIRTQKYKEIKQNIHIGTVRKPRRLLFSPQVSREPNRNLSRGRKGKEGNRKSVPDHQRVRKRWTELYWASQPPVERQAHSEKKFKTRELMKTNLYFFLSITIRILWGL